MEVTTAPASTLPPWLWLMLVFLWWTMWPPAQRVWSLTPWTRPWWTWVTWRAWPAVLSSLWQSIPGQDKLCYWRWVTGNARFWLILTDLNFILIGWYKFMLSSDWSIQICTLFWLVNAYLYSLHHSLVDMLTGSTLITWMQWRRWPSAGVKISTVF